MYVWSNGKKFKPECTYESTIVGSVDKKRHPEDLKQISEANDG
jgi:hypothetical protein